MANGAEISFQIQHLSFSYPEQSRPVLNDVSLSIRRGQFVALCGPSGCGKTTLLRHLKPILTPHGQRSGSILFEGQDLAALDQRAQSSCIGFVQQSPENQVVTDKVWHELAFGLESLGYDTPSIRLQVAEMASFFGMQEWFYKDVVELSGGQKQLLNLASIMVMHPSVLILDEPTSQLDPIAAAEFLSVVGKINRELGTTVLITEHRLEEVLPYADRMLVMDEGRVIADGPPKQVGQQLGSQKHQMFLAMPTPMRVYAATNSTGDCPITIREGREWLDAYTAATPLQPLPPPAQHSYASEPSVEIEDAWFKYEKDSPDVVKGLSCVAYPGEFLAILGGNGTGKTTALSLLSGLNRPYRGKVFIKGQPLDDLTGGQRYRGLLGVLPQNPQSLFVKKTVERDLYEMLKNCGLSKDEQAVRVRRVTRLCALGQLLDRHPYDLSGGEQQRAALAKVLLLEPEILLIDEPTKGLDAEFKQIFAAILRQLLAQGVTVIMVSHDIEFCAKYAHRCALFFDGNIVSQGPPHDFFTNNSFYTTSANRMARHLLPGAVTPEDLIVACGFTPAAEPQIDLLADEEDDGDGATGPPAGTKSLLSQKSILQRTIVAVVSAAVLVTAIVLGFPSLKVLALSQDAAMQGGSGLNLDDVWQYVWVLLLVVVSGIAFCLAVFGRAPQRQDALLQVSAEKRHLSKRTVAAAVMILLLIPLTIFIGYYYLGDRKYYFISMLVILESMLPFALIFEGRKPQARELVVLAVLCAIAVASRAALFMLPQFKPVVALVIITGVAFGAESGFLVGAMTGLVSNFFFGQGPWTPWQMFAFGIIGFLAGLLFRKGFLLRARIPLAVFGAVTTFLIYGGIMNPCSVLMYQARPTWPMFVLAYIRGLPFDLVHAAGSFFFLFLISQPMLEKLDRIKIKYGMVE